MRKTIIFEDGQAKMIYSDDLLPLVQYIGQVNVTRASNVEWEEGGWTVRAAHDPELAIRTVDGMQTVSKVGEIVKFADREEALRREVALFWDIIPQGG